MALKVTILIIFSVCCSFANGQGCTELLSEAEQAYRDGRFMEIEQKLCKCFGAYWNKEGTKIRPRRMRVVLESMKAADQEYAAQLGIFKGYWKEFIINEQHYIDSVQLFFTYEERYRAFILLGKLYEFLGVLPLAEFFAARAATMYPEIGIEGETGSFQKLFEGQRKRVGDFSIGPLIGWSYALPVQRINYRQEQSDYQYQSDGRIVLGAHYNYPISPSFTINMNFWFHGTRIVYFTEAPTRSDSQFDFYHLERQGWIKFPLLLKWSPANHFYWLRKQGQWKTKVFIAAGISANYLTGSEATIIDLASNTSLNGYSVTDTRNRFNSDFLLQILTRFQLGQKDYISIGFTGTYSLKNILDDSMVRSQDNKLYSDYGIVENNYKLAGGFWTITYERRINRLKK